VLKIDWREKVAKSGLTYTPVGAVNLPNGTLFQAFRASRAASA
jgi:hypothetical protein